MSQTEFRAPILSLTFRSALDGVSLVLFHMLRLMIAVFSGDLARAKESVRIGRTELAGVRLSMPCDLTLNID